MSHYTRALKQTCVYWAPGAIAFNPAERAYEDAVEIKCNWNDHIELGETPDTTELVNAAIVELASLVEESGYLWLGDSDDLPSGTVTPIGLDDAYEIKQVLKKVLRRGRTLYRAILDSDG